MTVNEKLEIYLHDKNELHNVTTMGEWDIYKNDWGDLFVRCDGRFVLHVDPDSKQPNTKTDLDFIADAHQTVPQLLGCLQEILLLDEYLFDKEAGPTNVDHVIKMWSIFKEQLVKHLGSDKMR